ncbi:hypothetical protein MMC17_010202 [Xylographa soralifera]|nr:hypothetical protein [Xylographa soralifera]
MVGSMVSTQITFLNRSKVFQKGKPYSIDPEIDDWSGDVARSNFSRNRVDNIPVSDIRGKEHLFSFEKHGFAVIEMHSAMEYEDFEDSQRIDDVYCHEVGSCLLKYLDAAEVHIFDVNIRRRHPDYPFTEAKSGMPVQPAARAHIDGTQKSMKDVIDELGLSHCKRFLYVKYVSASHSCVRYTGTPNITWRPLKGPVYDWPLAICDPNSVDPARDFDYHDHVYGNVVRENILLHYNADQRWHYLSGQMPFEMLVFRQVDSEGTTGV